MNAEIVKHLPVADDVKQTLVEHGWPIVIEQRATKYRYAVWGVIGDAYCAMYGMTESLIPVAECDLIPFKETR